MCATLVLSFMEESLNSPQSCVLDLHDIHTCLSISLLTPLTSASAMWLEYDGDLTVFLHYLSVSSL